MNKPLLRKVAAAIKRHPKRLVMEDWIDVDDEVAPCGTTACIAGHALILSTQARDRRKSWRTIGKSALSKYSSFGRQCGIRKEAEAALGLTYMEAERLFFERNWPERFKASLGATRINKAKLAVARINYFIRTVGKDYLK